MSLSTFNLKQPAASLQNSVSIVVLCERLDENTVQHLVKLFAVELQLHIVELAKLENHRHAQGRVLRPARIPNRAAKHLHLAESSAGQLLWNKCTPGETLDQVLRYCARNHARLIIVLETADSNERRWWRKTLAEQLACYLPVLSIPHDANCEEIVRSQRRFRWIVPLDGSPSAEAVIRPLRSIACWLPSDILFVQPLEYSQLWSRRIASKKSAPGVRSGVSIADSSEYLKRITQGEFAGANIRVCCLSDSEPAASLARIAHASTIDGVAIGLSNQWRIGRWLSAEFNELMLGKIRKPCLLVGSGPVS